MQVIFQCKRTKDADNQANRYTKVICTAINVERANKNNRVATAQGKQGIWMLTFPDRGNTWNLVILIFTQGKLWQHRENFECLVCVCVCVYCVYMMCGVYTQGVYKSALCQGQASCALNLPSCRIAEMGQMSLEGSYWGEGEGFPSAFWVFIPTQNVQGKCVNFRQYIKTHQYKLHT